ncbi:5-amino-6-(5-phospho-D-ribitylamino)uracil phosphatase [Anaerolineae bacterium]|nr:5-amino-6-(5-phospho-D-ribitylamino)uracil phosphatase [Anaerolineae bacterium]
MNTYTTSHHPIRLIAVDLDGTLLNTDHHITPRTRQALSVAGQRGIQVIMATGRPRLTTIPYLQELGLTTPGVFMQGLNIYNGDGSLRHNVLMDSETVRKTAAFAVEHDLTVMIYNHELIATRYRNAFTDILQAYHEPLPHEFGDKIIDLPDQHPVNKLFFIDDPSRIPQIRAALTERIGSHSTLQTSMPQFLEVLPAGASKGAGLKWLLEDMGISPSEVLAIGDGENDIEMIQLARIGVAMGNGNAHLKAEADYITLSNNEDGVAHAVEKFALGL